MRRAAARQAPPGVGNNRPQPRPLAELPGSVEVRRGGPFSGCRCVHYVHGHRAARRRGGQRGPRLRCGRRRGIAVLGPGKAVLAWPARRGSPARPRYLSPTSAPPAATRLLQGPPSPPTAAQELDLEASEGSESEASTSSRRRPGRRPKRTAVSYLENLRGTKRSSSAVDLQAGLSRECESVALGQRDRGAVVRQAAMRAPHGGRRLARARSGRGGRPGGLTIGPKPARPFSWDRACPRIRCTQIPGTYFV